VNKHIHITHTHTRKQTKQLATSLIMVGHGWQITSIGRCGSCVVCCANKYYRGSYVARGWCTPNCIVEVCGNDFSCSSSIPFPWNHSFSHSFAVQHLIHISIFPMSLFPLPSVLTKAVSDMTYNVFGGTLNFALSNLSISLKLPAITTLQRWNRVSSTDPRPDPTRD